MTSTAKSKNPKADFGAWEEKTPHPEFPNRFLSFHFSTSFLESNQFLLKQYFCFNVISIAEAKSEGKIIDALSGLGFFWSVFT